MVTCFPSVLGRWSETYREKVESTPLSTWKRESHPERRSPIQRRPRQAKGHEGLGLGTGLPEPRSSVSLWDTSLCQVSPCVLIASLQVVLKMTSTLRLWRSHQSHQNRMLALSGPLEFMFYSMLGTYQETEAHTGKSYFPNVTGQKWFFPPSIIIILLYQSAIYYTVPTTWQGPIYNAGIEGVRLACSLWSQ